MSDEDPCAILAELRARHRALVTGNATRLAEIEAGNGGRKRVEWADADIPALERLIRSYEAKCTASIGGPSRRHAIEFG